MHDHRIQIISASKVQILKTLFLSSITEEAGPTTSFNPHSVTGL